jgi:ferredoxin--NADP+ reductase
MSRWVEGTIIDNQHWTDQLYSLKIEAEIQPFKAGQFGRLALDIEGKRVGRPYSFVNAPDEKPLEFYSIIVPEGPLSSRLHHIKAGDKIWVSRKGAGFFTLSWVPEADYLWMLSTGTALGPFLSILKTEEPWQRFKKIVLVHAVRYASELTYQNAIRSFIETHPDQFSMIAFVSREDTDFAIRGRVPAAIQDGSLLKRADMPLNAEESHVMICGNPDMVKDTSECLVSLGFKKNQRREPGQITTENYW